MYLFSFRLVTWYSGFARPLWLLFWSRGCFQGQGIAELHRLFERDQGRVEAIKKEGGPKIGPPS